MIAGPFTQAPPRTLAPAPISAGPSTLAPGQTSASGWIHVDSRGGVRPLLEDGGGGGLRVGGEGGGGAGSDVRRRARRDDNEGLGRVWPCQPPRARRSQGRVFDRVAERDTLLGAVAEVVA